MEALYYLRCDDKSDLMKEVISLLGSGTLGGIIWLGSPQI